MKLDRGNPNLVKKAPPKDPNAAPPPQMNLWKRDKYVPESMTPARRGADDFLRVQSRGF
jgi:hypothetical protein